jgi:hypothetical protein
MKARTIVRVVAILACALAALCLVQACSSQDSTSSPTDGGAAEGSAPSDSGNQRDAAGDANSVLIDSGSDDSGSVDAGDDSGLIVPTTTIPLAGIPQRLAYNPTSDRLYATLSNAGPTGGIVVIDGTSDTVLGSMGATNDAGAPIFFDAISVDSTGNAVYAGVGTTIYRFDGTNNALVGTIDLSGLPAATTIYGLATDGAGKKLYAVVDSNGQTQVTVAVIDTTTVPGTVGPTVALTDIFDPHWHTDQLVIDTKNHLLFVCGLRRGDYVTAVDTIDTTNNTVKGSQQAFPGGGYGGCVASPGFGALLTTGNQPHVNALEPVTVDVPPGNWTTMEVDELDACRVVVNVIGVNAFGDEFRDGHQMVFQGEKLVETADFFFKLSDDGIVVAGLSALANPHFGPIKERVWVVQSNQIDGGTVPDRYITKITVTPPPVPDGGCP